MVVPAPDLLSTTTCWPQVLETSSATRRALVSVGPPAAIGTTICTARSGQAPARAARKLRLGASADAAERAITWRRVSTATPRGDCHQISSRTGPYQLAETRQIDRGRRAMAYKINRLKSAFL